MFVTPGMTWRGWSSTSAEPASADRGKERYSTSVADNEVATMKMLGASTVLALSCPVTL